MISVNEALQIHEILIDRFGGSRGLRDKNLLEASLQRPYQTFDNNDLYATSVEKAAAIIESLIINHPFIDGNKRFGYVAMRLTLMENRQDISANEDDKYDFVIKIAKGVFKFNEILDWINNKLV